MTHAAPDVLHGTYTPPVNASKAEQLLRALAITGFVTAATLLAGIIAVALIPDQLNSTAFDKALVEIAAHRHAEIIAGWMFAFFLTALIPFIWLVVRSLSESGRMPATIGACVLTAGATVDIVASLLLVAIGHGIAPSIGDPVARTIGIAMLNLGAAVDAMYNLALGIGLILIARSMRASGVWPKWLTRLALVAGVLSLPVSLEWYSQLAAAVQYASGTLFLVWVVGMSVVAARRART